MIRVILLIIVTAFYSSCHGQDWFTVVYNQLNEIDIPINSIGLKKIENKHQITIDQYNEIIGSRTGYINDDGLRKNTVYGYFDENTMIEGLNPPTFSVIGKVNYHTNYKGMILRIDEDPRLDASPTLQFCLFDENNNYLSGIMISGGETESYSCKILSEKVEQYIITEDTKITNTFVVNSDGYFELVEAKEEELEY